MDYQIHKEGKYNYIDQGEGEVLLLLHGLFGALSNWNDVLKHFSKNHRVVIPIMPFCIQSKVGSFSKSSNLHSPLNTSLPSSVSL